MNPLKLLKSLMNGALLYNTPVPSALGPSLVMATHSSPAPHHPRHTHVNRPASQKTLTK